MFHGCVPPPSCYFKEVSSNLILPKTDDSIRDFSKVKTLSGLLLLIGPAGQSGLRHIASSTMEKLSWAVEHWMPLIVSKTGDPEHSFDCIEMIDFIQEQPNQISEDLMFNPWICHGSRARDNHVTKGSRFGILFPQNIARRQGRTHLHRGLDCGRSRKLYRCQRKQSANSSLQIDVSFCRI
jgi:hypothetical protein